MAIAAVVDVSRLDNGIVLAPERYDPRRRFVAQGSTHLLDIVHLSRETIDTESAEPGRQYLVLATGNARDGIIRPTMPPSDVSAIGSTKKRIRSGQVIISRLRPYLRQVAWVDPGLSQSGGADYDIVCSTEFYVLDSKDGQSIAFLVPFLLSYRVQRVLAASQEGGHHPRFNDRTLKSLPIPAPLLEQRAHLSAQVEGAVTQARKAFRRIGTSIGAVDAACDA